MLINNWKGVCWHCQHQLRSFDYQRENRCPTCSKSTHCCYNCAYFQPGIANDCKEPIADLVQDKEQANFCDYFLPASEPDRSTDKTDPKQLLDAAEDLFN